MRHYLFQLPIIFLSEFSPSPSPARLALPAEACAPAGAAAAPPRSPRSGVKGVLYSTAAGASSGALHTPRTPVLIAIINRRVINAALSLSITYYFYRNFRLPQAPRGSRFLRKLAPLRARRLRRPARRARGLKGVLYSTAAGAPPLRPVGEHFTRP